MAKIIHYGMAVILLLSFFNTNAVAFNEKTTPTFHCYGTHPKWTLNIDDKKFRVCTPGPNNFMLRPVKPIPAEGMNISYMRVYETKVDRSNQPVTIVIKDDPEGCTDGQSPEVHGYNVVVSMPGKVFTGCCDIDEKDLDLG